MAGKRNDATSPASLAEPTTEEELIHAYRTAEREWRRLPRSPVTGRELTPWLTTFLRYHIEITPQTLGGRLAKASLAYTMLTDERDTGLRFSWTRLVGMSVLGDLLREAGHL